MKFVVKMKYIESVLFTWNVTDDKPKECNDLADGSDRGQHVGLQRQREVQRGHQGTKIH